MAGGGGHVLVLHGKRQCGELFEQRIARTCKSIHRDLDLEFHFPDAPFELPIEDGDDIPMRSWWNDSSTQAWTTTLQQLDEFLRQRGVPALSGIFGFSQGGALAALLACNREHISQQSDAYPTLAAALASVKFIAIAGAPHDHLPTTPASPHGILSPDKQCSVPSLHFIGTADVVVAPQSSEKLAQAFHHATVYRHDKAHVFPSRSEEVAALSAFVRAALSDNDGDVDSGEVIADGDGDGDKAAEPPRPFSPTEEQQDELESLEAIYDTDFQLLQQRPPMITITLHPSISNDVDDDDDDDDTSAKDTRAHLQPALTVTFVEAYPDAAPVMQLSHVGPLVGVKDGSDVERQLAADAIAHLSTVAKDALGMCMVMTLVDEAQQWLEQLHADVTSGAKDLTALTACLQATSISSSSSSTTKTKQQRGGSAHSSSAPSWSSVHSNDAVQSRRAAVARMMDTGGDEDEDEEEQRKWSLFIRQLHREVAAAYPAGHAPAYSVPDTTSSSSSSTNGSSGGGGGGGGAQQQQQQQHGGSDAGVWKYTIGLVGKPSAGKSTFFNAITDPKDPSKAAKVAAYSFTTIDPNVGQGYFTTPCPSEQLPGVESTPAHGFAIGRRRKVPVIIKDVAGLVPGAYKGRGKGNAFLNDLCDADVLIHVVDASGMSDENGVIDAQCSRDPADDVQWVQEEIHRWIFNNVRAKWNKCLRGLDHFVNMFSGYQSRPGMVIDSLKRAGHSLQDIERSMLAWGPRDLHRVVAHFLRIRFPILLALNKADKTLDYVDAVRATFPNDLVVPMCAKLEWQLCTLRRKGLVDYQTGGSGAVVLKKDPPTTKKEEELMSNVHKAVDLLHTLASSEHLQGSGVLAVIDTAVHQLRPPLLVYPVTSFETMQSPVVAADASPAPASSTTASAKGSNSTTTTTSTKSTTSRARAAPANVLAHCLLLRPATTVGGVYEILKGSPLHALAGDFVRAEYYDMATREGRQVRRTQVVTPARHILRIMTTKKRTHAS
ncbi:hypothetical protein PTSG_12765 [Salpingoeca rosetta]|uniref:OBG-type G domain-containing protein n=1 Tax=Salpingoeca rosetta (strain ATCC 50818 / BSB-021) TaxID=946362 RepID=F2UK89_SALR5|nr:uncharacterized protein PTSG_12765 [Salpingoeca rosetta]EGD77538.1 hypothetical protein PTSG_12765 [Salpingoeca rosetta]|eukprot:XP_004990426.1 hypothetical protein PTSG_12765 [Salpingoeca rosetta]